MKTSELPEPELGYIQTDKSNQPAFSARQMREAMQTRAQVQDEPMAWNSIQIASWIGSKLMHEPSMFERATVCKFVRSLGRHPTLLKHSPKIHPAPSVPADIDALIHRVSVAICLSHSAWDLADARVLVLEILKQAAQPAQSTQAEVTDAELLDLFESQYPVDGATVRAQLNGDEVVCIDAISAKVGWTRFKNDARAILALRSERLNAVKKGKI